MRRRALARTTLAAASLVSAALAFGCGSSTGESIGIDHSANTGGNGYCRTTTCPVDGNYPTADGRCEPDDWSESAKCRNLPASNAPLFWRTSCVGYDLNELASRHVSYDDVSIAVRGAFEAWLSASCPSDGTGPSHPSIDVRDLGAVSCAAHTYDAIGPNQNVIVFHDDTWPYEAADKKASGAPKSLTIAATRVTYNADSGEIYDADVELNSADYVLVPLDGTSPVGSDTFDLQTILTHELGHFLGLAHAPSPSAVMYASGDSTGSTSKRELAAEDVRGICAIYPPDHTRSVSTLVDPSGRIAAGACDPTPRHGFSRTCGGS
jgi:hypothetical protein